MHLADVQLNREIRSTNEGGHGEPPLAGWPIWTKFLPQKPDKTGCEIWAARFANFGRSAG